MQTNFNEMKSGGVQKTLLVDVVKGFSIASLHPVSEIKVSFSKRIWKHSSAVLRIFIPQVVMSNDYLYIVINLQQLSDPLN